MRLVELAIDDLAFDGKAVAHLDGKVVFLDAGLPGETVLAEITRTKSRYSQAVVKEILNRSPRRIAAVCSHFGVCGGCSWQDLQYSDQLIFKKRHVTECLTRLGGMPDVVVKDVLPSEDVFHYRNKMEFSFHAFSDERFHLGLHRRGHFDDIFDLETCHLQNDLANRLVTFVRDYVRREKLPIYDVSRHVGYMRFLMIRRAAHTGQIMVNVVTNRGSLPQADRFVSELCEQFPEVTTVVHGETGSRSNVAISEVETVLYGPGRIEEELLGLRFRIRAGSFFQTNTVQAERLYQAGFDLLRPHSTDRLLDLYCGTGTIGLLLAAQVAEVVGVELVPDAVLMARENAALNGIANAAFFNEPVKEFLHRNASGLGAFDVVVIDPPRAGLHPKALKRVIALSAGKLLYFSCNPATFARDARELLEAGYAVSGVRPVDMFPHTRHIELTALFAR
jgi:23S rRNA (uracil1939-C5)-methyltransferase